MKSVVTIGREMAAKMFSESPGNAITITEPSLAQLLAIAAMAGYEECANDVRRMLVDTRGDKKCS